MTTAPTPSAPRVGSRNSSSRIGRLVVSIPTSAWAATATAARSPSGVRQSIAAAPMSTPAATAPRIVTRANRWDGWSLVPWKHRRWRTR